MALHTHSSKVLACLSSKVGLHLSRDASIITFRNQSASIRNDPTTRVKMTHLTLTPPQPIRILFFFTLLITSSSSSSSFLKSIHETRCAFTRGSSHDGDDRDCVSSTEHATTLDEPIVFRRQQDSSELDLGLKLADFHNNFHKFGPNLRMMKAGKQVRYESLDACLSSGATAVFSGLENGQISSEIQDLVMRMEDEMVTMVHANAYVTPQGTVGLSPHFDIHDFFVIQVQGSKVWDISAPILNQAISKQHVSDADLARSREVYTWQITLSEGDVLYMPRGYIHAPHASESSLESSVHVTFGLAPLPWSIVLSSSVRESNMFQRQVIPNVELYFSDILDTFIFSAADEDNSESSVLLRSSFPLNRVAYLARHNNNNNESCPKMDNVKMNMNLLDSLSLQFQLAREAVVRYASNLVNMKSVLVEMIRQASNNKVTSIGRKRWKRIRSEIRSTLKIFESDNTSMNIGNACEIVAMRFSESRLDRSKQWRQGDFKKLFL